MFKGPQIQKKINQSYCLCVLHIVSWYFTFVRRFIRISGMVFNSEWTWVQGRNGYVQCSRAITPKVGKPELQFMCSARHLIVLYICLKFRDNISNGFQLTERMGVYGRNGYVQCSKGNNSKSRQTRVAVHVFCFTFVWSLVKISLTVSELRRGHEWWKRRRTDTQNFGRYNIIPSFFYIGGKIDILTLKAQVTSATDDI